MIIPAILEHTFEEVKKKIKIIEEFSPVVQLDILDNTIVEGNTFNEIQSFGLLDTTCDIEIHFMVENPLKYIKSDVNNDNFSIVNEKKINNVSTIITQLIDEEKLNEFIKISKNLGYKIGLSINYDQDNSLLDPFIKDIDLVQFMSVIPGKQGNEFIPNVLDKIKEFKNTHPTIKTQVDGGINDATLPLVLETGVDNVIIGSAILNSIDPKEKYLEFLSKVR